MMSRADTKGQHRVAVGCEKGKPIAVYDVETGDVVAYIPDGKTTFKKSGDECQACESRNMGLARRIATLINLDNGSITQRPVVNFGDCANEGDIQFAGERIAQLERELAAMKDIEESSARRFCESCGIEFPC